MKRFLLSYGVFTGGVIGVGVFALPAVLQKAGLFVFLLHLLIVSVVVWFVHRWHLTVVLATKGRHRLPGYARLHLGGPLSLVCAVANILALTGALVAYLIAGGTYVRLLFAFVAPLPQWIATGLYVLPGTLLLLWGLRALPSFELAILGLFLLTLGALPVIIGTHFTMADVPLVGDSGTALLPYGVLLFALWGVSLIPETAELAGRSERRALRVLSTGLVTAVVAYALFAVLIAGVTGRVTTEDALTGLRAVLGNGVVVLTLVFGILTTFSSYLALGLTLLRTLTLDFKTPRLAAWALTTFVPLVLVLLGVQSLLVVLGLTGAVFLGIEGLVVLAMRWRLLDRARGPRYDPSPRYLRPALVTVAALLVFGVVGTLARHLVS